jgi:acylphosphatase
MDRIAVRLSIRGRVQRVGYRWWARDEARRLGLDGWVRNLDDGSVELVASGAPDAVAELTRLCWRGPAAARVTGVDRADTDATQILPGFEARP